MLKIATAVGYRLLDPKWDKFNKAAIDKCRVSTVNINELLAYYRGEPITPHKIDNIRKILVTEAVPLQPNDDRLRFKCIDGIVDNLYWNRVSWRRNFTLIDDFLSEYPDATEIEVAYSCAVVTSLISGNARLSTIIGFLSYLNPKYGFIYLDYDISDITTAHCRIIFDALTPEERTLIRSIPSKMHKLPVLLPGTENDIVSIVPYLYNHNCPIAIELLKPYPSFLTVWLASTAPENQYPELDLLLTAVYDDYAVDSEGRLLNEVAVEVELHELLLDRIGSILECRNIAREEAILLLSRIGLRSAVLGNENHASGPYLNTFYKKHSKATYNSLKRRLLKLGICTKQTFHVLMWEYGIEL